MVISDLFQQQQLFLKQLGVTVIFYGDRSWFRAKQQQMVNNHMNN